MNGTNYLHYPFFHLKIKEYIFVHNISTIK